jgi:hypothetical protein
LQLRRDITRLRAHDEMTRFCESKPTSSILEAVVKLEELEFTSYLLSVPEYNRRKLEGLSSQVKEILQVFNYSYNKRIAGAHGHFTRKNYITWLRNDQKDELVGALARLARLNQTKFYLFWEK